MSDASQLVGYSNGAFLPLSEIAISPYDLGFLRGYAVFDVMPTENRKAFLWERHYERLCRSAEELGLVVSVDQEVYKKIIDELIVRNQNLAKASIRTVLSGGPSEDSFTPAAGKETFIVLAEETHTYPATVHKDGIKVITLEYARILPQVKLANHVVAIHDLPRRKSSGALEALYVSEGYISEATQSNVFIVRDGKLITTWNNVLWGVTQGLTLELAEKLGILTEKRNISLQELLGADEVFITSSSKHIVPVVTVDDTTIGAGKPGKVTRQLMAAFADFVEKY